MPAKQVEVGQHSAPYGFMSLHAICPLHVEDSMCKTHAWAKEVELQMTASLGYKPFCKYVHVPQKDTTNTPLSSHAPLQALGYISERPGFFFLAPLPTPNPHTPTHSEQLQRQPGPRPRPPIQRQHFPPPQLLLAEILDRSAADLGESRAHDFPEVPLQLSVSHTKPSTLRSQRGRWGGEENEPDTQY